MIGPRKWARVAVLGVSLGYADSAVAEHKLEIAVSGVCPSGEAVISAIGDVLGDAAVLGADPDPTARVVVIDEGASYRVRVGNTTRAFLDPSLRCDERARKVAVVVALALAPPVIEPTAEPALALAPPVIEPAAEPALALAPSGTETGARMIALVVESERGQPPTALAQFEAGGTVDGAPAAGSDQIHAGIDLRLAIGSANPKVVVGAQVVQPMILAIRGGQAQVQRVPFDLGGRMRLAGDRFAAMLELGVRFTVQSSHGLDVMHSVHAVRLETGARVAARIEAWPSRLYGAYLQVQGEYVPRPSQFTLPGVGVVGEMPGLWVGTAIGLSVRMY